MTTLTAYDRHRAGEIDTHLSQLYQNLITHPEHRPTCHVAVGYNLNQLRELHGDELYQKYLAIYIGVCEVIGADPKENAYITLDESTKTIDNIVEK